MQPLVSMAATVICVSATQDMKEPTVKQVSGIAFTVKSAFYQVKTKTTIWLNTTMFREKQFLVLLFQQCPLTQPFGNKEGSTHRINDQFWMNYNNFKAI